RVAERDTGNELLSAVDDEDEQGRRPDEPEIPVRGRMAPAFAPRLQPDGDRSAERGTGEGLSRQSCVRAQPPRRALTPECSVIFRERRFLAARPGLNSAGYGLHTTRGGMKTGTGTRTFYDRIGRLTLAATVAAAATSFSLVAQSPAPAQPAGGRGGQAPGGAAQPSAPAGRGGGGGGGASVDAPVNQGVDWTKQPSVLPKTPAE